MERCPLCRATLNGAETCRRCRAELQSVIRVEHEGSRLIGAAIHSLSLDDVETAGRLLRRSLAVHAAPDARALWRVVTALPRRSGLDEGRTGAADESELIPTRTEIDTPDDVTRHAGAGRLPRLLRALSKVWMAGLRGP